MLEHSSHGPDGPVVSGKITWPSHALFILPGASSRPSRGDWTAVLSSFLATAPKNLIRAAVPDFESATFHVEDRDRLRIFRSAVE